MTSRTRRSMSYPLLRARWAAISVGLCVCALLSSCKLPDIVNNAETPSDIRDPKVVQNAAGAIAMYRGAIDAFALAVGAGEVIRPGQTSIVSPTYVALSGVFTDELITLPVQPQGIVSGSLGRLDLRYFDPSKSVDNMGYESLHLVRGRSRVARAYLRKYGPDLPAEWQAHLYAMEGFAEVLLAELRCSGIPLGTLGTDGQFTVTRGFSTDEVYDHAIVLFDSALATAGDSSRFLYLSKLGKARALLGKGDIIAAAQAVQDVPDTYRYVLTYVAQSPKFIPDPQVVTRGDNEGLNGLPFVSSNDPRTSYPDLMNPIAPLVFATGVEVRLLQAEAAVRAGDANWLVALNALRTTCALGDPCPSPVPAGLGGVANLPPLADPVTGMLTHEDSVNARIDLVFSERAFWLYLTGRRQGDLRRLVRHYRRPEGQVYPVGPWGSIGINLYGTAVVVPVPDVERDRNHLYKGCGHLDA